MTNISSFFSINDEITTIDHDHPCADSRVFMDVSIGGKPAGCLLFELFHHLTPKVVHPCIADVNGLLLYYLRYLDMQELSFSLHRESWQNTDGG